MKEPSSEEDEEEEESEAEDEEEEESEDEEEEEEESEEEEDEEEDDDDEYVARRPSPRSMRGRGGRRAILGAFDRQANTCTLQLNIVLSAS